MRPTSVKLGRRALLEVIVASLFFEIGEQGFRRFETPIRQHHHIITLVAKRLRLDGIDDHRRIHAQELLAARVTMKPIGAALLNRKAIGKGRARLDAGEADAGHAVHLGRQQQPVPVNRRAFFHAVRDAQRRLLPFFQPDHGTRDRPIDRDGRPGSPVKGERGVSA